MDGKLQVSVLGNLALFRDAAPLSLPQSKKTRALLAYLAVTARPHRRERLCDLLWNVPNDPRAALRWSLSRLRPLVDDPDHRRIVADRENVALDLGRVTVDVLSMRERFRHGADSIDTHELLQAAAALEGDFLEGLDLPDCREFQGWCTAEREATRRLRARLLAALIARLEDQPEEALSHARALSVLEPGNENAQATCIRLLRATGRWREADECLAAAERYLEQFDPPRADFLRRALQLPMQAAAAKVPNDQDPILPDRSVLSARAARHEIRFCRTSDNVQIAYATVGDGPPLVWAPHWLSHLAFSWESPILRHWTDEFAKDHCFVHYDERGSGLSGWDNPDFSHDAFVRDLETVVDTIGLDRFALIGMSKGGSTSIAYAARHPERVSHLILYGAYAEGWRKRGNVDEIERREAMIALMRQGWTQDNPAFRQINTSLFLPDATLEEMRSYNDLQQISASAENAVRLQQSLGDFNVLDLLPRVAAPTIVLHCRDDAIVPFEQGRMIASRIPGARFVALDSRNHTLVARDPAWANLVEEVRQFFAENPQTPMSARPAGNAINGGV